MKSARLPKETSAPNSANSTPIEPRPNTQAGRLLAELKAGRGIGPLTSWAKHGVYRLSDVIYQLRRLGWSIQTEIRPVRNRFGEECKVGFYTLIVEADDA